MSFLIQKMCRIKSGRINLLFISLIVVMIAVGYGNSLENEFTNWDDNDLIVNNTRIRSLDFENVKKIFAFKLKGGTYQPFRVLSYAIDYKFWKFNPVGYHIHSIVLHMIAVIFLYLSLILALTHIVPNSFASALENKERYLLLQVLALFTSLLFALHPANVEAVTWLSSRKYVLLGAFSFSSFYFFIKSAETDSFHLVYNVISILLFIAAAFSSPFGVILPALFFLFLYCRDTNHNPFLVLWKNKKPLGFYIIMGSLVFLMLWHRLVSQGSATHSHYKGEAVNTLVSMFQVLFDYARNFVCPLWLNNRYVNYTYISFWDFYKVPGGLILIAVLLVLVILSWKKGNKFLLFCAGWFFVAWLPTSNIIPISTMMADRYVYIASAGCFLAFSYGLFYLFFFISEKRNFLFMNNLTGLKLFNVLFYFILISIIIVCTGLTFKRNQVWKNSGTLWADSLEKDSKNFMALTNRGSYLYKKKKKADKAIACFEKAHQLSPDSMLPLQNLSYVLTSIGKYEKAIPVLKKILMIKPENMKAHAMLGQIYYLLNNNKEANFHFAKVLKTDEVNGNIMTLRGNALYHMGQVDKAIAMYRKGIDLYPDNAELAYNLGVAYSKQNNLAAAENFLFRAIDLNPLMAEAYNEAGLIFEKKGDPVKAEKYYKKALEHNAGLAEAYNNLGNIMFNMNRLAEAVEYYKEALLLNNDLIDTRFNLCVVHEKKGSTDAAFNCYGKLIEQWPDHPQSLNNIGSILAGRGEFESAETFFRTAVELKPEYSDAYFNLADILKKKGDIQAVLKILEKLSHKSSDIKALRDAGNMLINMDETGAAIGVYKKITAMKKAEGDDFYNLGVLHARKGENQKAFLMFQKALKVEPDNKNASAVLERIVIEKKVE